MMHFTFLATAKGGMLGMQKGKQVKLPKLISIHHQQKTKARCRQIIVTLFRLQVTAENL